MKILVAYDGSQPSRRALHWATQIQGRPDVTIIGVIQTLAGSEKIADAIDPVVDLADHHRQLKEAAETSPPPASPLRSRRPPETLPRRSSPPPTPATTT
jgi:nucleotide-binding universal stress UspA family protein